VLHYEKLSDGAEVLLTKSLSARSAVDPYWKARPVEAVTAVGKGLRKFHEALPVNDCPFTWSVQDRVNKLPKATAQQFLKETPELDLVVCHGDPCIPNTLLTNFGTLGGHVDLGELGVADRWADLAVAAWSAQWNYGEGYERFIYEGYGIPPDEEKIDFYRRLWDAAPDPIEA
jgi:kanamycin kinase